MKYAHVLSYVAATLWAMTPEKLHEILAVLAFRASGQAFTPEELQARIGDGNAEKATVSTRGAVAVIPIRGVIAHRMGGMDDMSGGTSVERVQAMIRQAVADERVGTILYDIDSPGGTIPGVQELAAEMFALRGQKRQVALANSMCASAAYWLGSQADEVVVIPSGTVGSIGVYTAHQDLSKALELQGIDVTLISAGKHKVEGNPFEPLSEEALAFIQARVDEAYSQFVKDVARGRGVSPADVRKGYGEGRALSAKDAKAAGLVDRIATMDDTLARLAGRSSGGMRADVALGNRLAADDEYADAIEAAGDDPVLTAEAEAELARSAAALAQDEADRRRRMDRF